MTAVALKTSALRSWASGTPHDAEPDGGAEPELDTFDEESGEDEISEDSTSNPIWAGTPPEQLSDEDVEEFLEWLAEAEPDIFSAASTLAEATIELDTATMDAALEELKKAEQYLVPEFPKFEPEQAQALADALSADPKILSEDMDLALTMAFAVARKVEVAEDGAEDMVEDPEADASESGLTA